MNKKVKYIFIIVFLVVGLFYMGYMKLHTFTIADNTIQIQPITGKLKVISTVDTSVDFIDVETKETYTIGYITPGIVESIELEKGRWYIVEGAGEITIKPIAILKE